MSAAWARFVPVADKPGLWECRGFDRDGPLTWFRKGLPAATVAEYSDPARCRIVPCPNARLLHRYTFVDGQPVWHDDGGDRSTK